MKRAKSWLALLLLLHVAVHPFLCTEAPQTMASEPDTFSAQWAGIVPQHLGSGTFLIWAETATKLYGHRDARIAFIVDFWLYAMRFQSFKNFANTAARHCDVSGEVLATGDHTRLAKGGKPHGLRLVELMVLKCRNPENAIDHRRWQSLLFYIYGIRARNRDRFRERAF